MQITNKIPYITTKLYWI